MRSRTLRNERQRDLERGRLSTYRVSRVQGVWASARPAASDASSVRSMRLVLLGGSPRRWANTLAPSAESRRAFGTGPDDCVSSRLLHKGVGKALEPDWWETYRDLSRSNDSFVPSDRVFRPIRTWVVPSQIDAPDLWVVCATATVRSGRRFLGPRSARSDGEAAALRRVLHRTRSAQSHVVRGVLGWR